MQDPIRIDVSQVNGHGHHRGLSAGSPDLHSAGFTAVNGMKSRNMSFRPGDSAVSPYTPPDKDYMQRPSSGLMQYHSHGFRSFENDSPQARSEPQFRESPITGKRKRTDLLNSDDIPPSTANGDVHDALHKRPSGTLDSAIDLTSPANPTTEPIASEVVDSDSSEQERAYERETTPIERWNQGDPPPKPRPETEASLAASLHQFKKTQQITEIQQARSISPHRYDVSPPNEADDLGESHSFSDDQYNGDGSDPKRRKRNFSNRTKTGCHTCRSRKKKCDEGKPTCLNCERSGHPCKGYGPKPPDEGKTTNPSRSVMPLQSKLPLPHLNSRHNGTSTRAEEGRSYSHWGRVPRMTPPPPPPPPPPPEPEHRPYLPVAPPDHRRPNTADNWQKPPFPPQEPPPPYLNDRLPPPPNFSQAQPPPPPPPQQQQPYQPFPPAPQFPPQSQYPTHHPQFHAPPQNHPPPPPPPHMPQARQSAPPPPPLHMPLEPWRGQPPMPTHPTPNGARPPSIHSSRDSVHSGSQGSGPFGMNYGTPNRSVEKDKMLRGQPFLHYLDHTLLEDRQSCQAAVERYNKAAETNSGISTNERAKLFTQILKPSKRPNAHMREPSHSASPVPKGYVGDHTIVETPFKCEYGYNIHIGKDCIIESGAYFQDAADIGIGDRVTIGHNVKLYCITANLDPNARRGSQSNVVAGAIAIQEGSFIGADVIVLPYVTVGRGAVVGAGSVVTKDVEPNTVVAGNPAKLIRRIEGPNMGRHHSQQIQKQQEVMQRSMVEYANSGFSTNQSPRIG